MFSMLSAFCTNLDAKLLFNFDATQFIVGEDADNQEFIYIKSELDGPLTGISVGKLDFGVKLYHFHNAAGYVANPVYVVSDDKMADDAFQHFEVNGLSNVVHMYGAKGYLCFAHSRSCNLQFYQWFVKDIVLPHILFKCWSSNVHGKKFFLIIMN